MYEAQRHDNASYGNVVLLVTSSDTWRKMTVQKCCLTPEGKTP